MSKVAEQLGRRSALDADAACRFTETCTWRRTPDLSARGMSLEICLSAINPAHR